MTIESRLAALELAVKLPTVKTLDVLLQTADPIYDWISQEDASVVSEKAEEPQLLVEETASPAKASKAK